MVTGKKNIFLIGPMGAGKSTVGRMLAKELNFPFYDSDEEIEKRTGVEVSWIFDLEGEHGFRLRESMVLNELTQLKSIVLATGGGIVLSSQNRQYLASRGTVIYLKTSITQQLSRLEKDQRRPLLQTPDRENRLEVLHQQRDHLYLEIADHLFDTDVLSVKAVTHAIIKLLINDLNG